MNKKNLPTKPSIPAWTFLSNHAHVLLCLARDPEIRLREIAVAVGVTERAVNRIISELEEAEYISKDRVGRRNQYSIVSHKPLRHPLEAHSTIKTLLDIVKVKKKRDLSR